MSANLYIYRQHVQSMLTIGPDGPVDTLIHLASNADIAAATTNPGIDFDEGTALTHHVCEFARRTGIKRVLYASGSGVYGEIGGAPEDFPYAPISTYGASKVAGEMLLRAYCSMFGIGCAAFRFANIVGPRQTHGVGYDFLRRLKADPKRLEIRGDGSQTKGYLHVEDAISAMVWAADAIKDGRFEAYNVAPAGVLTVTEIAIMAAEMMCVSFPDFSFGTENRGWKGDVPQVRLPADKIRALGWTPKHTSFEAMTAALVAMKEEIA